MNTSFEHYIFLAEPFGFGPISSSIAIARQLKILDPQKKIIFMGSGTSHQLAVKSNIFDENYFVEDMSESSFIECNSEVNSTNCLIIANTYPKAVLIAKQAEFKCVFIDTLFWMWNQLPIKALDVMKYFIEEFHCTDVKLDRFGFSDIFMLVPPLIDVDVPPHIVKHPFLLVSLGGIDSSLYDFPVFYQKLIEYISKEKKLKQYNILICGGGNKFRENEFKKYENSQLIITCLGPHEYMSKLRVADIVLSSAGLHGFYENYFLKKNVMFLPPQSYSQYLQLKYILNNFSKVIGANFENLEMSHSLRENMPELERINEVKRTNKFLIKDPIWKKFLNIFEDFHTGKIQTDWKSEKNKLQNSRLGPVLVAKEILSLV
ncbi:hypothetical protein [Xanthocytophaga flava]|uniref:hypothetical protein n=1 Tax=Xanthocytophaga flava TaxID=3048013 RepID=UPI0028D569D4|nr:hypothetical protein [Xanthocytophaga flavus]MDJ1473222.1 hypothetical protein [Xanthocytophaga flavus]